MPINDDIFSEKNRIKSDDADYIGHKKTDKIYVSDFKKADGKYISIVADQEQKIDPESQRVLYESARLHVRACYIVPKGQVVELLLEKFDKKNGKLDPASKQSVRIDTTNLVVLKDFIDFLQKANLSAVAAGRISFDSAIQLDPDIQSKLIALSQDEMGKKLLVDLFDNGYVTSGLDIPDLIRKGLSPNVIDEKYKQINEFEALINKPGVKEVQDIQTELGKMPWIFGPEYVELDVRGAGDAGIPDRRLRRIDGLSDILEVKLPSAELLRKDTQGRHYIAPDLAGAMGQLTGYLEYFMSEYREEKSDKDGSEILEDRYGKYYKPKGILLIGRREGAGQVKSTSDAHPKFLRRLTSYFHWVEVLTYDDLIERARNGLKNLTGK